MGNTIRRQPVNFNIPKSPDYKFLNITDFRGLHITDNPFTGDSNTASDLLNVYVDEQNTLTTRPRLQKKFDLSESAIIPEGATIISINYVDDKYLVQYKYNDEVCIFWLIPLADGYKYQRIEITKSENCSPIGESKIQIVKHKDYYVLVDGVSYKCIANDTICDASAKAYVPLNKINKIYGDYTALGTEFESLNFLTDKHKESYRIEDGVYPIDLEFSGILNSDKITLTGVNYDTNDIVTPSSIDDFDKALFLHSVHGNLQSFAVSENFEKQAYVINDCLFLSVDYGESFSTVDKYTKNTKGVGISPDGNTMYVLTKDSFGFFISETTDNGVTSTDKALPSITATQNGLFKCEISISRDPNTRDTTFIGIMSTFGAWYSNDNGSTYSVVPNYIQTTQNATNETQIVCETYARQAVFYQKTPGVEVFLTTTANNGETWYNTTQDSKLAEEDRKDIKTVVIGRNGTVRAIVTSTNMIYMYSDGVAAYKRFLDASVDVSDSADVLYEIWFGNGSRWFQTKNNVTSVYNVHVVTGITKAYEFITSNSSVDWVVYGRKNNRNIVALVSKQGQIYNNYSYARDVDFLTIEVPNVTEHTSPDEINKSVFLKEFNNFLWLGGNKNFITHSAVTDEDKDNNVLYMPVKNKTYLGNDDNEITGFNVSSDNTMIAYTKDNVWLITRQEVLDNVLDYVYTETRSDNGHVAKGQTIITPLNELPLQLNKKGFFVYQPIQNVLTSDKTSVLISEGINAKLLHTPNLQNAYFVNHLYWSLTLVPEEHTTHVFVFDDRNSSWYYWTFGEKLVSAVNIDDEIELTSARGRHFTLETTDIINEFNSDVTEYYDDGKKIIPWFWKTQVLPLGTMNYSKKLVDTTFIVADTEMNDEYGLNYAFTAYRKMLSETTPTTISSKLNYVQSTTKRTLIPRFNFLQLKISNVEDDLDNNKLRLIGLGLKYVLLEGLLR